MVNVKLIVLATAIAIPLAASGAKAQNFYGANGDYQGQARQNSFGSYSFYGANGEYQGQANQNSSGGYNFYGANGEYQGQQTAPPCGFDCR